MEYQRNLGRLGVLSVIVFAFFAGGCVGKPEFYPEDFTLGTAGQYEMDEDSGRVAVPIFFGTDREFVESDDPSKRYSDERSELSFGKAVVSVGKEFKIGRQEDMSAAERAEILKIESVDAMERGEFVAAINEQLGVVGKREVAVIVHGYNEDFDEFLEWVGQLVYEIGYEGVVVVYSWPSWGMLSTYTVDENNVEWTIPNMVELIKVLRDESDAEVVHLVSHSMGVRALSGALMRFAYEAGEGDGDGEGKMFGEVVFAAADIDVEVLASRVPVILPLAERYTIYRSSTDLALLASEKLHGDYARAVQGGDEAMAIEGVDTVDVSYVDDSVLGHVYLAQTRAVVSDLFMLLNHRLGAGERNLLRMERDGKVYWLVRP